MLVHLGSHLLGRCGVQCVCNVTSFKIKVTLRSYSICYRGFVFFGLRNIGFRGLFILISVGVTLRTQLGKD